MPTELSDVETGGTELLFPDDLEGIQFELTEAVVYNAEEVREATGNSDVPEFGDWIPVETNGTDAWLVALSEIVEELQIYDAPTGNSFQVTRCEKSGPADTDPYEVNLEAVDQSDQTGL